MLKISARAKPRAACARSMRAKFSTLSKTFLHYHYSQHLRTFRIWRVVILLMRAKCVGPARVSKKAYYTMRIYMQYVQCTLYIAHTAHLFLHTFCIYNEVYNQS